MRKLFLLNKLMAFLIKKNSQHFGKPKIVTMVNKFLLRTCSLVGSTPQFLKKPKEFLLNLIFQVIKHATKRTY